jgi:hypothetical protein
MIIVNVPELKFIDDKNRKDDISLIMRIKNGEDFLEKVIQNVINDVNEIICVFNDCTDSTEKILVKMESAFPQKIKVYHYIPKVYPPSSDYYNKNLKSNDIHSLSHYYNFALSKTNYKYICKHDDDNLYFANIIKENLKILKSLDDNKYMIGIRGINLFDYNKNLYINESCPFTGGGDTVIFKYNKECYFYQTEKYEKFHTNLKIKKIILSFYHLKFCKKDRGLNNYETDVNKSQIRANIIKNLLIKDLSLIPLKSYLINKKIQYRDPFSLGFNFLNNSKKQYNHNIFNEIEYMIPQKINIAKKAVAKKAVAKKAVAKKVVAKKVVAKKAVAKKAVAKKAVAKKAVAKKAVAKKAVAKKAVAKKAVAKKAVAKKAVAKKAVAKKAVAKKAVAKKAVNKKAVDKKAVAKKAVAKKAVAKKAVAKKAVAKKAVDKKAVAKKAVAKKAVNKKAVNKKAVNKKAVNKKAVNKKAVDKKVVAKKAVAKVIILNKNTINYNSDSNMIKLFDKVCIYDKKFMIIYCQYKDIKINSCECYVSDGKKIKSSIIFCDNRPDFLIIIFGDIIGFKNKKYNIIFNQNIIIKNINFKFPFEKNVLNLFSEKSNIISTMCKNYNDRLEEWIEYNLKLGFDGIVIFNNEENMENIKYIADKYKKNVYFVDFPYKPFEGNHWNHIQRISICIGVNAFKNICRYIALIDADEFIYLNEQRNNINDFLKKYNNTINMGSNILTNKKNNDIINNNILSLCKYVGENKYTKIILKTSEIKPYEFIVSPHKYKNQIILDKSKIIHYHCWVNERYKYNDNMNKIDFLENFYKNNK